MRTITSPIFHIFNRYEGEQFAPSCSIWPATIRIFQLYTTDLIYPSEVTSDTRLILQPSFISPYIWSNYIAKFKIPFTKRNPFEKEIEKRANRVDAVFEREKKKKIMKNSRRMIKIDASKHFSPQFLAVKFRPAWNIYFAKKSYTA